MDPNLPGGLVPFNVQDISGEVYVTYALAGRTAQADATAGMGVWMLTTKMETFSRGS